MKMYRIKKDVLNSGNGLKILEALAIIYAAHPELITEDEFLKLKETGADELFEESKNKTSSIGI